MEVRKEKKTYDWNMVSNSIEDPCQTGRIFLQARRDSAKWRNGVIWATPALSITNGDNSTPLSARPLEHLYAPLSECGCNLWIRDFFTTR